MVKRLFVVCLPTLSSREFGHENEAMKMMKMWNNSS